MNSTNIVFVNKLKEDFNINVSLTDVVFTKTRIELYNNNENKHSSFGEKLCLLYLADFTIYNIQFSIKILTFNYDNSNEVLKLDITIPDKWLEKEMASCRNFLQRNRNLNLTFNVLTEFAKFLEARRLICEVVFTKEPRVNITRDEQGGIKVKCLDILSNMYFGTYWRIEWNLKNFSVIDMIEFYYTNFDNRGGIKEKMEKLTHPSLDFHNKLKVWKALMSEIQKYTKEKLMVLRSVMIRKNPSDDVLIISDTEDEEVTSSSGHWKKRRIDNGESSSTSNSNVVYTIPD
ncbi:unnamed protein product [Brassicogethes aeneus]|uniref:Uncharacterized protein n=1 Tax=Brassicogethes aeneus TaxID=1431903 RepID=A0A9P0AYV1_BRAAE|nr:unnamed protein product [Brassicogethes aeneus]